MLLFFYSFSQSANDVFRETFGPASITSSNHWTVPLKRGFICMDGAHKSYVVVVPPPTQQTAA